MFQIISFKQFKRFEKLEFRILLFLVFVFIFSFLDFNYSQATVLYLEPAKGEYYQDDTFIIEARIDTEGECINTVEANLSFPLNILEAVDFSLGNSILIFWVSPPSISQETGLISFTGGIPGGYCGKLPGDPGESNLLGRIIFKVKETPQALMSSSGKIEFLENSQVLLNDGFGTPAKLGTKGAALTVLSEKLEVSKDEWQEEIKKDITSPELFEIKIHQDPAVFEGKYFIIFSTTDKQTGIDHYEIKEGKGDWIITQSPCLLKDQSLQSTIKVKAVDKAGNERIAEYIPAKKPFPYWVIILVLVGMGIIIWRLLRRPARPANHNEYEH
ncbi:MAG: hypothetical protein IB617_01925 [Candidatus Nealsonbacteria bacterium]|nr:MAG: hypothetical protein IB617_01925 [Candidatus Nealsonbacteria bacterium]